MTDQTPGCGATSDARKRRTEAHQIHPDPSVCVIVAREVAAAERAVEAELGTLIEHYAAAATRYLYDLKAAEKRESDLRAAVEALADECHRLGSEEWGTASHAADGGDLASADRYSAAGEVYDELRRTLRALLREPKP